jgi:hypothetical protein
VYVCMYVITTVLALFEVCLTLDVLLPKSKYQERNQSKRAHIFAILLYIYDLSQLLRPVIIITTCGSTCSN